MQLRVVVVQRRRSQPVVNPSSYDLAVLRFTRIKENVRISSHHAVTHAVQVPVVTLAVLAGTVAMVVPLLLLLVVQEMVVLPLVPLLRHSAVQVTAVLLDVLLLLPTVLVLVLVLAAVLQLVLLLLPLAAPVAETVVLQLVLLLLVLLLVHQLVLLLQRAAHQLRPVGRNHMAACWAVDF